VIVGHAALRTQQIYVNQEHLFGPNAQRFQLASSGTCGGGQDQVDPNRIPSALAIERTRDKRPTNKMQKILD